MHNYSVEGSARMDTCNTTCNLVINHSMCIPSWLNVSASNCGTFGGPSSPLLFTHLPHVQGNPEIPGSGLEQIFNVVRNHLLCLGKCIRNHKRWSSVYNLRVVLREKSLTTLQIWILNHGLFKFFPDLGNRLCRHEHYCLPLEHLMPHLHGELALSKVLEHFQLTPPVPGRQQFVHRSALHCSCCYTKTKANAI